MNKKIIMSMLMLAAPAASAMHKCKPAALAQLLRNYTKSTIQTIKLQAPDLSTTNIIGYNVGVRPYRKSGIRIGRDLYFPKPLIHNYGYHGSGITLSWGGAQEVMDIITKTLPDMFTQGKQPEAAVLGIGVIGLTTAYELLEHGFRVRIYTDQFSPNLTSNVAAGIWGPPTIPENASKIIRDRYVRMLARSKQRFESCTAPNPAFKGIRYIDHYNFHVGDDTTSTIDSKLNFKYSTVAASPVRVIFDTGIIKEGTVQKDLAVDGDIFMGDLLCKVLKHKNFITVQQKKFLTSGQISALRENIVVNCTSLGSRELFYDKDFVPVRGQLIYLGKQNCSKVDYLLHQNVPDMKNFWVMVYPWHDRIIIGGVFEPGKEELKYDPEIIHALLNNARNCFYLQ